MLIVYVAVLTLILIFGTAIGSGQLSFDDYAFPILMHLVGLAVLGPFCMKLAFEGEWYHWVADETKTILCSSMIYLEAHRHNELHVDDEAHRSMESARFATAQLHESLTASRTLHPMDVVTYP